jgi:hypothetical protein
MAPAGFLLQSSVGSSYVAGLELLNQMGQGGVR